MVVFMLAILLEFAQLWEANGPLGAVLFLPLAIVVFLWPFVLYALAVSLVRTRWPRWHLGPACLGGLVLLASQIWLWRHQGFGAESGGTGAVIYGIMPFYQAALLLPAAFGLGLLVQASWLLVVRHANTDNGRPASDSDQQE